ncbi:MAG: TRAP transporter large permease [Oscillospiraceae bacterium]|nr:TRAP transporter large permease [Oscillospiraceae bacterium]
MLKYFVILLVVFIAGVPVAIAMGGTAALLLILERGLSHFNPAIIAQKSCYGLNNFLLLSIPLFLYAGKIMNTGNITKRIFDFCKSTVGWLHGGLGHVNILCSVIFAGMTGTATSDAAGIGQIEIQAMREAGYDDEFTFGITAGSSLIGPIIPPSIPLVIYGMMTGVSIGKLLIAGIVPGIILAAALGVYVEIVAKRKGYPRDSRLDFKKIWHDFKKAFLSLLTPIIIIGGIMSGVFTATEAAAVAALYATILTVVVYREIDFKGLCRVLWETVRDSGSIMMICYCASCYGYVITKSRVALQLADKVMSVSTNPFAVCMLLVAFLLVMGCFMENLATITIMSPVFYPLLVGVGFDPLAFGIIMVLTLMIGLLTPPFGMVLFVLSKVGNYPLQKMIKAALPFIIPVLLVIVLLALYPQIITFLPNAVL